VESFKSTLDEVREADLLVHVVDISHPDFEEQMRVVEKTLGELGASDKPCMVVFNKIDAYTWVEKDADDLTPPTKENISLDELMKTWMARMGDDCFFISAKQQTNIAELKELLYGRVRQLHVQKYPYNDFLFQNYNENGEIQ
jgi:GTP-binding protein HflX